MQKITNQVKKVPLIKAEQYKRDLIHFGYTVTGETTKGNKVILQVNREPTPMLKKIMYYEKQYHLMHKKVFPVTSLVFLTLGLIFLIVALVVSATNNLVSIIFYTLMGITMPIGIFALVAFFILKIKRKKITLEILKRCDQLQGFGVCELPNNSFDNTNTTNIETTTK